MLSLKFFSSWLPKVPLTPETFVVPMLAVADRVGEYADFACLMLKSAAWTFSPAFFISGIDSRAFA